MVPDDLGPGRWWVGWEAGSQGTDEVMPVSQSEHSRVREKVPVMPQLLNFLDADFT